MQVPVIDQTAAPAPQYSAPGVAPMHNAAPMQQEALGQQMLQTGEKAMSIGGTIGDRLAEQVDDATVKKAETTALTNTNDLLYGQKGYLNTRGQDAIDGLPSAKEAVVKGFQDQLDALPNSIQKQMFSQLMSHHLVGVGQMMDQHNVEQGRQLSVDADSGRAKIYSDSAITNWKDYATTDGDGNSTGPFAKNIAVAEDATLSALHTAKGAPADSPIAQAALLGLHSIVGDGVIQAMMTARAPLKLVQQTLDDMKSKTWLDARTMDELDRKVKTYSEGENQRVVVTSELSDADRKAQGLPTTSVGTPEYAFGIKGAVPSNNVYDADQGNITIAVPQGSSVQAPADGKIVQLGKNDDEDFALGIQHPDGSTTTLTNLSTANVKVGDQVTRGQDIATSAGNVQWSLADKDGNAVDPTKAGLPAVDLTKITNVKTLFSAIEGIRERITDPELQDKAVKEAENTVFHNISLTNDLATQTFKSAANDFYPTYNWRNINPVTWSALTSEQRSNFQQAQTEHVLQQYNQGQAFKNMNETGTVAYFDRNPDMQTPEMVDLAYAQGKLSNSTYLSLYGRAEALKAAGPKGVANAQQIQERVKYYADLAGINMKPKTQAENDLLNAYQHSITTGIDQIKDNNHGKATSEQVENLIQLQTSQYVTAARPHSPNNPFVFTGIESNDPVKKYRFQIPDQKQWPKGATQVVPNTKDGTLHYFDDNKNDLGQVQ